MAHTVPAAWAKNNKDKGMYTRFDSETQAFSDDEQLHPWVRQAIIEHNRDRALTLNWSPSDPSAYDRLDLPDLNSTNAMRAREQIITEALVAGPQWTSYSRRWPYYTQRRRYWRSTYSYRAIMPSGFKTRNTSVPTASSARKPPNEMQRSVPWFTRAPSP
jgi:TfoX/Sxy family transcriptional regulator of competence genes